MDQSLKRGNMLWEGSRFTLPEHVEALAKKKKESNRFLPPELDQLELEELNRRIQHAFAKKCCVIIGFYDEFSYHEITGMIEKIDVYQRKILISSETGVTFISFDKLLKVEFAEQECFADEC
ncbi:YolD-like family protein [Microaerobacter geothermalis]|uniref:YolD-like family protein n=1 Tax=Microaerobacter geothermalis TaxID=674972 RepID=UPI001F4913A1|nr:YolD-like family protein [Microaerobacter geothermalis]MCF6094934.1 YolD-like family protein [Microaerobacter geothermalis]